MRDKDDSEKKLWQSSAADAPRSNDPLSELTRIVGQGGFPSMQMNDPAASHKTLPTDGAKGSGNWINDIEQAFNDIPQQYIPPAAASPDGKLRPAVPGWLRSPAVPQIPLPEEVPDPRLNPEAFTHGFHQELSSVSVAPNAYYAEDAYQLAARQSESNHWDSLQASHEQQDQSYGAYGDLDGENGHDYADDVYHDEAYLAPPPNRRKAWVYAAVACGVGVIAVIGAFALRTGRVISDEVPVIAADNQPVKIEPETPGGAEVPNINKAIYEHTNQAPTGEGAIVVDNREQPVDVDQMLAQQRDAQAQAEDILEKAEGVTTTTTNTVTTGSTADVVSPEAPEPVSPAVVSLGEPKRVRTVAVRPDGTIVPSDGPVEPTQPTAVEVVSPHHEKTTAAAPVDPVVPAPATVAPVARPEGTPERSAPRTPAQAALETSVAQSPAAGSYTVQLAAPGSENEARNLYTKLQRKHGELARYAPTIVRADSKGRTIYRLRVGAFSSRDAATALCVRIQATGGQCFVAKN